MSTDYQPGRIVSVQWTDSRKWDTAVVVKQDGHYVEVLVPGHEKPMSWNVRDVRPLVVLDLCDQPVKGDLTGRNEPTLLVSMLRETADNFFTPDAAALADKVADQIEAQTKPPRIPEPGLWGVVEAPVSRGGYPWQWVHHPKDVWLNSEGDSARWSSLIDPTLIREGLS